MNFRLVGMNWSISVPVSLQRSSLTYAFYTL